VWYADVPAEQTALILRHNGVWSTWGEVTLGVGTILPALLCALPVVRRSAQVLRVLGFWIMLASLAEAFWLIAPLKLIATPFSLAGLLLIISTIIVVGLMVLMSFTVSRKK
jgi:flagellar biosynthesis protein FlhB